MVLVCARKQATLDKKYVLLNNRGMGKRTDPNKQLEVVAMFARGDTYAQVHERTGIAIPTLQKIKDRNREALDIIKGRMLSHAASKAAKIKDKALDLIEYKVDKASEADKSKEEIIRQAQEGEITWDEANTALRTLYDASLSDLTAVSREMHQQIKSESQSALDGSVAPQVTKDHLKEVVAALDSGDEIELQRIVFRKE